MKFDAIPPRVQHLVAALAIVVAIVTFAPTSRASGYFGDFNAFYCAGATLFARHDPYLAEPIGSCERRPRPDWLRSVAQNLILPAPLPPYALSPFIVLSRFSFLTAASLWSVILLAAFCITVWSMRRATGLTASILIPVFAIQAYAEIYYGETVAIAVAAIAVAVMLLERRKSLAAALAASVALIEPHLGLPAVLALFVCLPKTRIGLFFVAAGLGGACVAVAGIGVTLEYLHEVLPHHALSEVPNSRQLSLTSFVHLLGAPDRIALNAGSIWYGAMIVIGIVIAHRFKRRRPYDGLIVAAPVALVLLGGVFIHVTQMEAGLPAALIGFARTTGKLKHVFAVSIVLLAIPWVLFTDLGLIFVPIILLTVAFLVRYLLQRSMLTSGLTALVATGFVIALIYGLLGPDEMAPVILPNIRPADLAEVNWALHVAVVGGMNRATFVFARVPTWCGIALLAGALCTLAARPITSLPGTRERSRQHLLLTADRTALDALRRPQA